MRIISRAKAVENLKQYIGKDLLTLAAEHDITTYGTGKQNKGWKGLVLECLAGLDTNNDKAPNGLSFELKSVSFHEKNGELIPKETMAITMINPEELRKTPFFKSHCWEKLKSIIFCAVMWHGKDARRSELLEVTSLDFLEEDTLIQEVKADYEFIQNKLVNQGFEALTGKDGKRIQARTKGPGHGSTSRAFYARKEFVAEIFNRAKVAE